MEWKAAAYISRSAVDSMISEPRRMRTDLEKVDSGIAANRSRNFRNSDWKTDIGGDDISSYNQYNSGIDIQRDVHLHMIMVLTHRVQRRLELLKFVPRHVYDKPRTNAKYLRCLPITLFGRICDFRSRSSFVDNSEVGESKVDRLSRNVIACSTTNAQNCAISPRGY